ncbi:ECF transporter S component [Brachyspira hyodysenteriae]|uniref:ECF transporter S component n=1 Tax=Brachyspira hyodysenteriae TaxID=159 RepID=UPI0022CD2969|nr:ECF transporter S component [Brachyspira hyodysenteriae]MCZ9893025.1 ECF transporter S component [Brachyspira hyodysenteriae]MCZ9962441.1 ECF transporter S component [Brachyspira hyodysenteriae]MCZ9982176.1 ECF transporter S component [Brachyspira hyodysenteriae]MCZ9990572.1 ECF transporter S component [Brachyspira hyodysenteriae]MCZ9998937.1 ECF transporter S component [Brachyspira hyodysenteriae]
MNNDLKYNILIAFIGIVINFALTFIVLMLKIPFLFLDSVGTILSAVLLGPIYGAIVGILTNLIISIFISYSHLNFAIVNALIGIIIGIAAKKFKFGIITAIISGTIIGIISPLIGTPISIILSDGFTGTTIDSFIKLLNENGFGFFQASFMMRLLTNILDKVLSCLIVYIAIKKRLFYFRKMSV